MKILSMVSFETDRMRYYLVVFFYLFGLPVAKAQNLLMNGSFEDSVDCTSWLPISPAEVTHPYTGISAVTGSVDHLSAACVQIPWNSSGYVIPQDGNAVVGFFAWEKTGNQMEIPQVKIIQPLLADSLYRVSFYIYLADKSRYAINQIRVAMMVDSIYLWDEINNFHLGNSKVCWESNPNEFVDNRYWRQYAFDYVATGQEKFMAVSSLQKPADIIYKMVKPDATGNQAYYYIDNLQVVKVNKKLIFPNVFTPNGDGINDAWEPTIQGYPEFLLQVFNRWGNCVFQTRYLNEPWNGGVFNNPSLPCTEGVYYYLFQATHPAAQALQSGTIHLFR